MLHEIRLKNFQSYTEVALTDLDLHSMYLLSGRVGSGKSSIGEALCYALFGRGRTDIGSLVRLGSAEDMVVELGFEHRGVYYEVTRTVSSGVRHLTSARLRADGKKVAQGAGVTKRLVELLGYDLELFLLTDYYGLDTSDALLRGKASERLETLQSIVNVGVYESFHKHVVGLQKATTADLAERETRKRFLGDILVAEVPDTASILADLEDVNAQMEKKNAVLADIEAQTQRQSVLMIEQRTLEREMEGLEQRARQLTRSSRKLSQEKEELLTRKETIRKALEPLQALKSPSSAENEARIAQLVERKGRAEGIIDLFSAALSAKEATKESCPLCGQPLQTHGKARWRKEKLALEQEIAEIQKDISHARLVGRQIVAARDYKVSLQEIEEELVANDASKQQNSKENVKAGADLKRCSLRLEKVKGMIGDSDNDAGIRELTGEISRLASRQGSLQAELEHVRREQKARRTAKSELTRLERELVSHRQREGALALLERGWSRYGIPLDLMAGARSTIEPIATDIFSRFWPATVRVQDEVERGNPGISFVVESAVGTRSFLQLSEGERSVLAFAVRIAISSLLEDARGPGVGFMFLDEIASHLSENERETLATIARERLLTTHAQIFVTSHAPIRDVFEGHIQVKKVGESSVAEVLET